jgi:hypothetical protein
MAGLHALTRGRVLLDGEPIVSSHPEIGIRIPVALPMVIVGLMIGSIFGLLTAVSAEMVGDSAWLRNSPPPARR